MSDAAGTLTVVVVAAGRSQRFGRDKLYVALGGRPVLAWSLQTFNESTVVSSIVLVVSPDKLAMSQSLVERYGWRKVCAICAGGARRQDSVWNGLQQMTDASKWVAIHDGARPFVTSELLERGFGVAREHGAAIAAVPVKETVKIVEPSGLIRSTPPRAQLWAAQTPQIFLRQQLIDAYRAQVEADVTDDAEIVERSQGHVAVYEGSYENVKITTREDIFVARHIARRRQHAGTWSG